MNLLGTCVRDDEDLLFTDTQLFALSLPFIIVTSIRTLTCST
jgi:hypothetical protein